MPRILCKLDAEVHFPLINQPSRVRFLGKVLCLLLSKLSHQWKCILCFCVIDTSRVFRLLIPLVICYTMHGIGLDYLLNFQQGNATEHLPPLLVLISNHVMAERTNMHWLPLGLSQGQHAWLTVPTMGLSGCSDWQFRISYEIISPTLKHPGSTLHFNQRGNIPRRAS